MLKRKRINYYTYINSPGWKRKSLRLRRKYGKCKKCGAKRNLCVHHRSYRNLGREWPWELVVWCKPCHKSFHQDFKYDSKRHRFIRKSNKRSLLRR